MAEASGGLRSVVMLLICIALVAACGTTEREADTDPQSSYVVPDPQLRAIAFIGDEYSTALDAGGPGSWATQGGKALGYAPIISAVVGSGYVVPGLNGRACSDRVNDIVATQPRIVVVACGMNDVSGGVESQKIAQALELLLKRISESLPKAEIIVVGPFADSVRISPAVQNANTAVRTVASKRSVPFVDPVGQQWLEIGQEQGKGTNILKLPGKNLLSPAGHREFARRFVLDVSPVVPTYEPR